MIASFLPTLVGFLMLPVYSKYLTPEDYGVVALILSLQSFLPLLMTLQLYSSISRFYFDYKNNSYELKVFVTTILFLTLLLSSFTLMIMINYLEEIISFVFPKTIGYNQMFLIGIISSFIVVFNTIFIALLRVQQKALLFMKTSIFLFCISLIINIIEVIIYERGAYGVLEATLISAIISFFVYFFIIKSFIVKKINLNMIINPLKYSIPLIPHSLSGLIFMYSDRIILEKYVSLSMIGLYMFSDKIAMAFKIIVNEFNSAFSPYFYEKSKESKEEAIKEVQNIALLFIYFISMLMTIVALFSVELVYVFFDERYFDIWIMIPLLSSAYIFRSLYCFSSSGLFYEKQTTKVAIITIIAGIVNICINLWLIPIYGIMVAIYTTILSFLITFIMSEILSYKVYYLQLHIKKTFIIVMYLFTTIFISIEINKNFFNFGYLEYCIKLAIFFIGLLIGYKLKLLSFKKLLKIKG